MNQNSKTVPGKEEPYEYIVPAVDRAARILRLLRTRGHGMTLAEVTEATGWHKSSVHKLLVTLSHHGLLDRNEVTRHYSLGIALIDYGHYVLGKLDIADAAKSFLKELADYTGETANYSVLRGTRMVIVDSVESRIDLRVVPPIGTMHSLTTESNGKAVLAFLPENQVHKLIETEGLPAFTRNSITEPRALLRELAAVRRRGYATDFEEFREGISAVSAPVFNADRNVMATLAVTAPAFRLTKEKAQDYGKKCVDAAARLSAITPQ
jgi:DNA-binding IclR family transcriptional regulator